MTLNRGTVVLVELDDELPQAATPTLAVTASAAIRDLLFSKCTCTSSSYITNNLGVRAASRWPPRGRRSDGI